MKYVGLVLKIIIIGIVVLIVGIFVFLKTINIDRFRGQVTGQMSRSINRDVSMNKLSFKFSVTQGVTLNIGGLTVADHPEFSNEPLFYIDSMRLNVDIVPFIMKRQILISKVEFDSPKINLIRNANKKFNIETLTEYKEVKKGKEQANLPKQVKSDPKNPEEEKKNLEFGDLLIRSVVLEDGTIIFTDHAATPSTKIPITKFSFQTSNLAENTPFPFNASASLWSHKRNINVGGIAQFNTQSKQVRIDDIKIKAALSEFLLDDVKQGLPALKELGIQGNLGGELVLDINQMILGEKGLLVLSSEGRLNDGRVRFSDSPVPIEHLDMHFEISESDLNMKKITMPLATGSLNISGRIIEYLIEQKFIGNFTIDDIDLEYLSKQLQFPAKVQGMLQGTFKGNGKGLSRDALDSSFAGQGSAQVINGRVIDVNLLKLVLSKLSFVPNLTQKIENNLPERYKEKLKQNDTVLEKVEVDARMTSRAITIDQAEISADGFLVVASGKVGFDQNLDLKADFFIPKDLSAAMVAAVKELGLLQNDKGQIHIPFKPYKGPFEKFAMLPDVEDITKDALINRGRQELRNILKKALDVEEAQPQEVPAQEQGQVKEAPQKPADKPLSPEEAIIDNILEMIPVFE